MGLVPEAKFFFEAELDLKTLALQRRRWINGTVFGYIYLLFRSPELISNSKVPLLKQMFLLGLLFCQLFTYAVVAIAPCIFFMSLNYSLSLLFPVNTSLFQSMVHVLSWAACILAYLAFVVYHAREGVFQPLLFGIMWVIGTVMAVGAFAQISVFLANISTPTTTNVTVAPLGQYSSSLSVIPVAVLYGVVVVTFSPLFLAFLHDVESFALMVITFIPYFLFLPMLVVWFGAYSFARTWDLTWGNRDTGMYRGVKTLTEKQESDMVQKLKESSATICGIVVGVNILFLIILVATQSGHNELVPQLVILLMALFVFGFASVQMFLSFVYFGWKLVEYYSKFFCAGFAPLISGMQRSFFSSLPEMLAMNLSDLLANLPKLPEMPRISSETECESLECESQPLNSADKIHYNTSPTEI